MRTGKCNFTRVLLAGSLVWPLANFAMGQQPRPGVGAAPQAGPAQPGQRPGGDLSGRVDATRGMQGRDLGNHILRGSQIIGATVNLRAGSRFGTVNDFVLGDGGCVEYVVASYGNEFVPIPWGVAMWVADQRVLTVDIDPARIRDIPRFRQISELTNQQFSQRVQTFYRGMNGRAGDKRPGANTFLPRQNGAAPHGTAQKGQPAGHENPPAQGNRTVRPEERKGEGR